MFRCERVIDTEDARLRRQREAASDMAVGNGRADDIAAAMEVENGVLRLGRTGKALGHMPFRAKPAEIDGRHRHAIRHGELLRIAIHHLAAFGERQFTALRALAHQRLQTLDAHAGFRFRPIGHLPLPVVGFLIDSRLASRRLQ